jgi:hypothetical protein
MARSVSQESYLTSRDIYLCAGALLAEAVEAAMFGAGAAGADELFAQGFAGAMDADAGVGRGDAVLVGEVLEALTAEVGGAQDGGILRLELIDDAGEAGADLAFDLRRWLRRGLKLARPGLEGFASGLLAAVVVNDGVAQQAVEPGGCGFVEIGAVLMLIGAQVGGLKDVFRERGIGNAALNKGEELVSLREELIERGVRHRQGGGSVDASRPIGLVIGQLCFWHRQTRHSQAWPQGQFWHFMMVGSLRR